MFQNFGSVSVLLQSSFVIDFVYSSELAFKQKIKKKTKKKSEKNIKKRYIIHFGFLFSSVNPVAFAER